MIKPSKKTIKSKAKKKSRVLTPEQIQKREQKLHAKSFKELFQKLGFTAVSTDGKTIVYKTRTGELDEIFVYENVVLIVEYTVGKAGSGHLLKKKVLYDKILADVPAFLEFAETQYPGLAGAMNSLYPLASYKIKILYVSKYEASEELMAVCPEVKFIHGSNAKYFQALVKTIERSARIEFLKFLGFDYEEVGSAVLSNAKSIGIPRFSFA